MANDWLDLMVKDEAYREHIDVKALRGKTIELEGPVDIDLVIWLLRNDIMPKVYTPGHTPTRNYVPVSKGGIILPP
jgi:hypothetical protein